MGWFGRKPRPKVADPGEKRGAERLPIFEITDVYAPGAQLSAVVKDISLTGLRFSTPRPIAPQTVLKVRIDYNPIDFPLRALVVWSRAVGEEEFDHGAEFVNVPADEKNLLADHLDTIKAALGNTEE